MKGIRRYWLSTTARNVLWTVFHPRRAVRRYEEALDVLAELSTAWGDK